MRQPSLVNGNLFSHYSGQISEGFIEMVVVLDETFVDSCHNKDVTLALGTAAMIMSEVESVCFAKKNPLHYFEVDIEVEMIRVLPT